MSKHKIRMCHDVELEIKSNYGETIGEFRHRCEYDLWLSLAIPDTEPASVFASEGEDLTLYVFDVPEESIMNPEDGIFNFWKILENSVDRHQCPELLAEWLEHYAKRLRKK